MAHNNQDNKRGLESADNEPRQRDTSEGGKASHSSGNKGGSNRDQNSGNESDTDLGMDDTDM